MDASVIVGILAIIVSLGTYALGRKHGRREREADRREDRINKFVDDYVDRARRHINTGITALIPSGVFRLKDDGEIRDALETCGRHLGKHPLGSEKETLTDQDLKKLFDFVADRRINFATTSVQQVLEMVSQAQR